MTGILRDGAAELRPLAGQRLAVLGYGNQGRSQALNLRDSGVNVIIGNIRDHAAAAARQDAFRVSSIAEACAQSDVVVLLIPDEACYCS